MEIFKVGISLLLLGGKGTLKPGAYEYFIVFSHIVGESLGRNSGRLVVFGEAAQNVAHP